MYLPTKQDTTRGKYAVFLFASTPLSLPDFFPEPFLRGLRRKCHRFQQFPSSPPPQLLPSTHATMLPWTSPAALIRAFGDWAVVSTLLRMTALGWRRRWGRCVWGVIAWDRSGREKRGVVVNVMRAWHHRGREGQSTRCTRNAFMAEAKRTKDESLFAVLSLCVFMWLCYSKQHNVTLSKQQGDLCPVSSPRFGFVLLRCHSPWSLWC